MEQQLESLEITECLIQQIQLALVLNECLIDKNLFMKTVITFMMAIGGTLALTICSILVFPDFFTSIIPGWHTVIYPTEVYVLVVLGIMVIFFVLLKLSRKLIVRNKRK
jgi:uncharacterized membrane protein